MAHPNHHRILYRLYIYIGECKIYIVAKFNVINLIFDNTNFTFKSLKPSSKSEKDHLFN